MLNFERSQNSFAAVYNLDGSRVNVAAPSGITETAEARFEGDTPP